MAVTNAASSGWAEEMVMSNLLKLVAKERGRHE